MKVLSLIFLGIVSMGLVCFSQRQAAQEECPVTQSLKILKWKPGDFDRSQIKQRLAAKQAAGKPWIAHVLVPLCDNDHQGIVPVNASLGNGQSLRTNLYWGAGYGIKTHFARASDWKLIHSEVPGKPEILERVVFRKKFPDGPEVILVADAYDGRNMVTCLKDFFAFLAGTASVQITLPDGQLLQAGRQADLIAFNGHNGLMDEDLQPHANQDGIQKDAVAIACLSHEYFHEPLAKSGGYPFLATTGLMAPEAYTMRAILDAWATGQDGAKIRGAAGAAYNKYQKCGLRGATNLFKTGW